jgi:nitrogen fixation/metabolism regulation signal transduction histidine kinase
VSIVDIWSLSGTGVMSFFKETLIHLLSAIAQALGVSSTIAEKLLGVQLIQELTESNQGNLDQDLEP